MALTFFLRKELLLLKTGYKKGKIGIWIIILIIAHVSEMRKLFQNPGTLETRKKVTY
jgi:hypothetical protein